VLSDNIYILYIRRLLVLASFKMQKKLKMRTKPAVKADAAKAGVEVETKDDLKSTVNIFRPFAKKAVVKDTLSDMDFKSMQELHACEVVAVNKAYMLRQAKAAKEAEHKQKLALAERQRKFDEMWDNMTPSQFRIAFLKT